MRGVVLNLTPEEVAARARYLASSRCAHIYYRLEYPNGGTDPSAVDPAARWRANPQGQINVTADCIAGAAWCGGWDRFQPIRGAHVWEGRFNCDSIRIEVSQYGKCFERLERPEPGAMLVYGSVDYDRAGDRDRVGHVGTIMEVPLEWDEIEPSCWSLLTVCEIGSGGTRANRVTSGIKWFGKDRRGIPLDTWFVRSIMR